MEISDTNYDPAEIEKFAAIAQTWWDPKGPFRGLHDMNPLRAEYISDRVGIQGKNHSGYRLRWWSPMRSFGSKGGE